MPGSCRPSAAAREGHSSTNAERRWRRGQQRYSLHRSLRIEVLVHRHGPSGHDRRHIAIARDQRDLAVGAMPLELDLAAVSDRLDRVAGLLPEIEGDRGGQRLDCARAWIRRVHGHDAWAYAAGGHQSHRDATRAPASTLVPAPTAARRAPIHHNSLPMTDPSGYSVQGQRYNANASGALVGRDRRRLEGSSSGTVQRRTSWRREWDSNPRYLLGTHAFQACAFSRSAISPFRLTRALAEREGFEPSVQFPVHRFSKPAPSASRPPLRAAAG